MKKLIKLDFDNTTRERKTVDSYSELYSHDKNNGSFEFEILNDTLTTEQVIALFKFTESNKIWKTTGTVEGNKVKVTFDTSLITQNETVICYLYFDEEQQTADTFRFKFKVKVSEIDKMSRYEVKERFINNTVIVDRLDVVTKDELKEALKNVGGVATEGLLTEVKAEKIYVKKTDLPAPYNNNTLSIQGGNSVILPASQSEIRGTGMPNGVVEAPIGATYIGTAKTNGALKWIKTTDSGNTGWKVVEGDTGWLLCKQFTVDYHTNSIYIRRINDTVHVKAEADYMMHIYLKDDVNLHLAINHEVNEQLSIDGFKPTTTIAHRITRSLDAVHLGASGRDESHAQSIGAFILGFDRQQQLTLKIFRASSSSADQCYVRPFSYLTEDEWPTKLP
ncbi:hypothetical protein [Gemella haemolysans]|uniref:hypothetical protein n=1 Tax=Gemella haemolysans TaxID=1379 RepID=UPI001956E965|nr:hypothetical protein [Gemella haemolysans]VTX72039.1 Uncharacterised protein [Gemella haemolysans]